MTQTYSQTFQARRALLRHLAPRYQQASPAQKTLLLNAFVEWTGYTRKYAIELLNHGKHDQQTIQRLRLPQYGQAVQQALFLAWKAAHYVCAKRLLPFLPSLVALLEEHGHLQLTEDERRQVLAMSVSTAERYLHTQRKPRLYGLSTTTPGLLCKSRIPMRIFSPWDAQRPGFVEIDLVAHCGEHLDGSFLYTLTLTDLATGWTECIPLLEKRAAAVLGALAQARTLFPFPLLGIDTDSGTEFLNEEVIAYCEQEQLTFTRGRPAFKNDQAHVEQKNGAVVREAVGHVRLVGMQAYQHLHEVYQTLRLVVNYFQPSLKLQAKVLRGERVRRLYDVAQTPLQRLLASEVLSEERQRELREQVAQIDPLALSEQLDALRDALLRGAHAAAADGEECGSPQFHFSPFACASEPLLGAEEGPAQADYQEEAVSCEEILNAPHTAYNRFAGVWEEIFTLIQAHPEWTSTQILQEIRRLAPSPAVSIPLETFMQGFGPIHLPLRTDQEDPWPPERIQGHPLDPLPTEPALSEAAVSEASPDAAQARSPSTPVPEMPRCSIGIGEHEADHRASTTIEQAIEVYLQEMRAGGRSPKTLEWHHTSLGALRRYLWRQFQLTDIGTLTRTALQTWVADLRLIPSDRTGARRTVSTVVTYARSARAFCNWLLRQGYVSEPPFPDDAIPPAPQSLPQPVEPAVFVHLLHVCQLQGPPGGLNAGMAARNRAILWLLLDTGLQVSELCRVRLADVDRASGTVTVPGKRGHARIFPLSADGKRALCAYLDQARLTPTWEPAVPEAQDRLFLTERRRSLTKSGLTHLFRRLNQRAEFSRTSICPSMLRDTYAIRFLQAGGKPAVLQKQLGSADPVSVKRYQHFCEQRSEERPFQEWAETSLSLRPSRRNKRGRRQE